MAVRNFWIEVEIDGRREILRGGPARKDGGMRVRLLQRIEGRAQEVATISCRHDEGENVTSIYTDQAPPALTERDDTTTKVRGPR